LTFASALPAWLPASGRQLLRSLALALALAASPAPAQDDPAAELDALSVETATSAGGLALADRLSDAGDLLGALAALDRVLMIAPASGTAQLLRASLLCRIDDKAGGTAQLARLKKRDFNRIDWNQASAHCAKARTAPSQRSERWMPPGY
jgi:hypothetical protein